MATFKEFARVAKMTASDKTSRARLDEILHVLSENKAYTNMTPEKAVEILEALGPTFVKLGQIMSDRSDIVPQKYCAAFATLRDDTAPLPFSEVLSVMNEAYAPKTVEDVFSSIDPSPLGSASIAQVHKAYLADGTKVAVKVRRPHIKEQTSQDIELMQHLVAVAQLVSRKHFHEIQSAAGFIDEIGKTTAQETDFTHEMDNLEKFYDEARAIPGIASPKGYPDVSSESVLVMEYVEGDELANAHKRQISQHRREDEEYDLDEIANRIAQSYISQFIDYGFFTSDPHMGNIILRDGHREKSDAGSEQPLARFAGEVDVLGHNMESSISLVSQQAAPPSPEIVWIDMGMMGTLSSTERQLVSQVFLSVARNDVFLLKKSMEALTTKTGPVDTGTLLEMLSSVLSKYRTADLSDINVGDVLAEVLSVLHGQNLIVNPSITMLVRGVVVMEGVLSEISPSTSIIEIVSEHVMKSEFSSDKLQTQARNMAGNLWGSAEAASKLPVQVSNTLEMLDMGELSMTGKIDVSDKTLSTVYASISRLCLALLSVGLFLGSSILCTTNMEPKFLGVPLLGALGFIGAAVLGVYLLVRIIQSRHAMVNREDPSE